MSTVTSCTACKLYSGLNEVSEGGVHLLFPFKQASLCSHYIRVLYYSIQNKSNVIQMYYQDCKNFPS